MRKLYLVLIALAVCLPSLTIKTPVSADKARRNPSSYAPGEVIVKLKENAAGLAISDSEDSLLGIARSVGERSGRMRETPVEPLVRARRNRRLIESFSRRGLDRTFVLRFDLDADIDAIIARLKSNEAVEYAEPNYRIKLGSTIPNDPGFGRQWALKNLGIGVEGKSSTPNADIKAAEAWDITTGSPEIIVAVSDTGIDINHPDLAANIYTNPDEIPDNGIDDDENGYVDDVHGFNVIDNNNDISDVIGHGTQMAGIIAAGFNNSLGISGVAQVKIMPVRFFTLLSPDPFDFDATVADAARSLVYAVEAGASIINASWQTLLLIGDQTQEEALALRDAVSATNDAGVLLVCIAGNDGFDNDFSPVYPGAYQLPNQIVVAATDFNDNLWRSRVFINTGFGKRTVHLAAPGVSVFTTSARGNCVTCSDSEDPEDWYTFIDGTSASAAFVSGVAALVMSQYPEDPATLIRQRILDGVEKIEGLEAYTVTGGRLNALGALTVEPEIPLPPPPVPPVLTRIKYKSGNGKLVLYSEGAQPGVVALISGVTYPLKPKTDRLIAHVPQSQFPIGVSVEIRLVNPDGGVSQPLSLTR